MACSTRCVLRQLFAVINRENHSVKLIEVKYRKLIDNAEILKSLKKYMRLGIRHIFLLYHSMDFILIRLMKSLKIMANSQRMSTPILAPMYKKNTYKSFVILKKIGSIFQIQFYNILFSSNRTDTLLARILLSPRSIAAAILCESPPPLSAKTFPSGWM